MECIFKMTSLRLRIVKNNIRLKFKCHYSQFGKVFATNETEIKTYNYESEQRRKRKKGYQARNG